MLRDLLSGKDPQVDAVVAVLTAARADVVLLTGIDWDHGQVALAALADLLGAAGLPYPHRFALRPNTGMASGLDLDANGQLGEARDAQGYGRFAGAGGMAVLSRLPIAADARDFSALLWQDLPGAMMPDGMTPEVLAAQRLSTTGHWEVPLRLPDGTTLRLLAWHATPPLFDGPEDRNGRRNHDEAAFWLRLIDGKLPLPPPDGPFVLLGDANLDPNDGSGRPEALRTLLAHPRLQDPTPRGFAPQTPGHRGDSALDTAAFGTRPIGLRVDYVLPSTELRVIGAGVLWPPATDPFLATVQVASRHRLVWVDISAP